MEDADALGGMTVLVAGDDLEVVQLEQGHVFMLSEHKEILKRSWTA